MIKYGNIIYFAISFAFVIAATGTMASAAITIDNTDGIVTALQDSGLVVYQGTDDVETIEAAINMIDDGTIFFKNGEFEIDRTVHLKSNLAFVGIGDVTFSCFNGVAFDTGDGGYSSSTILLSNNAVSTETNIYLQNYCCSSDSNLN